MQLFEEENGNNSSQHSKLLTEDEHEGVNTLPCERCADAAFDLWVAVLS